MDQNTKDELREIAASLDEDLAEAMRPMTLPTERQHEMRLRAIEAALTVLINTLAESK